MADAALTKCPFDGCGGRVHRLISASTGVIFKGSGFYETDYRRKPSGEHKPDGERKSNDERKSNGEPVSCPAAKNGTCPSGGTCPAATKEAEPCRDTASGHHQAQEGAWTRSGGSLHQIIAN